MMDYKEINGYQIFKKNGCCEILKKGQRIYAGSVDKKKTLEQIYKEREKEVVFLLKGKELLSYDLISEFAGERESTIKLLAEENECDKKDIEVSFRERAVYKSKEDKERKQIWKSR